MTHRRAVAPAVALLFLGLLAFFFTGCQALYFLEGKGDQDALYNLPKGQRVLVFVDAPASVSLPAGLPTSLGNSISDHLFKNKATQTIVGQGRLDAMRSDPTFSKLGVADIARATEADVVIYVNIIRYNVEVISGGSVSQGDAQALVKVVDKDGHHLWPPNVPAGNPIDAHVDETLADQRDLPATQKEIDNLLTVHVGRIFHKYSLDDPDMTK